MPCEHKFIHDLNLTGLDYAPTTLIVGTFNPSWPNENQAEWFYGRTGNNYFWDVLPRLYNPELNLRNEGVDEWKEFCLNNSIAITDILSSIVDADENNPLHAEILGNYQDIAIANSFHEFTFTDIVDILRRFRSIRNVYLTRQPGIQLFDDQWNNIQEYQMNVDPDLHIRNLLTPSGSARFQIGPYRLEHPNDPTPLRNFIFQSWQNQWHNQPNP